MPARIQMAALVTVVMFVVVRSSAGPLAEQAAPLPETDRFMAMVRTAIRIDPDVQQDFYYLERRREVKVSTLGKVSVGPLRTFEIFPSPEPGATYKRLVAIDGTPVDALELQRRDAEHVRDLDTEARRRSRETPAQQAKRLERNERERRERLAILEDALNVYEAAVIARELVDGDPTIVVSMTPRANARVSTREGNWMKQFQGRAWFAEEDGQFARLDMQATGDVSIGWGIVGRLHQGSRLYVERRRVGRTWLPARLVFNGTGKTLLFRGFELNLMTEYLDYKAK